MGRTDSRKRFIDVETGSNFTQSENETQTRSTNKCYGGRKRIPRFMPSRKINLAALHDKFNTELHQAQISSNFNDEKKVSLNTHYLWLKNNASYVFFLLCYVSMNVSLFSYRIYHCWYRNPLEIMARAFGQCLYFNCALLLTLILRRTITRIRNSKLGYFLPCDHHVHLHKLTGWVVFLLSILHTVFHIANFVNRSEVEGQPIWRYLCDSSMGIGWAWGLANQTGIALIVMLCIIVTFSHRCIRKSGKFELFYFTHLLAVPFWALLILHGEHFWKWLLLPGSIFMAEMFFRISQICSARGRTAVVAAEALPSKVMKLVIKKPESFEFRSGEYIYLNVPQIAKFEWHPFTVSSAPEEDDTFTVHIRSVGGWTRKLNDLFSELSSPPARDSNFFNPFGLADSPKKSCSSGSLDQDCSSIMEGKIFETTEKDIVRINMEEDAEPVNRYKSNLLQFNRKISALQPAVLMLENEEEMLGNKLAPRVRKRSSSCTSLNYSEIGSPKFLDSGNTSLTGSCSSLQNVGVDTIANSNIANSRFFQSFKKSIGEQQNSVSSPNLCKSLPLYSKAAEVTRSIQPVEVFVDGPYGSPSSSIFKVPHAVLVGAGIGVTPFASLLQSVIHKYRAAKVCCPHCQKHSCLILPATLKRLRKVDFVWVNRDVSNFEWFLELLSSLEKEQNLTGAAMERFLSLHLYNTGAKNLDKELPLSSDVRKGRPDWDKLFSSIKANNSSKRICVFYCGPPALAGILREMCIKYKLEFRREMF